LVPDHFLIYEFIYGKNNWKKGKERVNMKKIGFYILAVLISTLSLTATVSCYTIEDADGDGVIEVGETITFTGDDFIVESDGDVHTFSVWAWDFDGDFCIDAYGKVVTHTFENPGYYRGFLYEYGDVGYGFCMEIEVFISNDDSSYTGNGNAYGWLKNGQPGNGNHYGTTGK
jgi:hypothetical protein